MPAAEEVLRKALGIDPGLAKTHFFLGTTVKADGRYDEALAHLRAAAAQYPRDRVVVNQIGRVLFLKRQYADAVAELAYQGLGDSAMAKKHEAFYRRFKADESAQFITGPYRQLHPEDNNERQSVHEHTSAKGRLDKPPAHAKPAYKPKPPAGVAAAPPAREERARVAGTSR